jgi:hypothetical protein
VAAEVWQFARAKHRSPRWAFRVTAGDAVVFESAWVSVRYPAREGAAWLAGLIHALAERGAFPGCPGHLGQVANPVRWGGPLGDDCSAFVGDLYCHAEHLSGPVRGGLWYCSVSRARESVFHTADRGVQPRSGEAARWLCEVVVSAVTAGLGERCRAEPSAPADRGR